MPLTNTTLDAQGGLRLDDERRAAVSTWDTDTDFDNGVTLPESSLPARRRRHARTTSGTGTAATLTLPTTLLPLTPGRRESRASARRPPPSRQRQRRRPDGGQGRLDLRHVVPGHSRGRQRAGDLPRDLGRRHDLDARQQRRRRCCRERAGAFDAGRRLRAPTSSTTRPTRSRPTGCGTRAAQACSERSATRPPLDGLTWTKYSAGGAAAPGARPRARRVRRQLQRGRSVVLKDGSTWKMWYTGDDSNKKRIAYATSHGRHDLGQGRQGHRAGGSGRQRQHRVRRVRADRLEDGERLLDAATGRKLVGGGVFQTKIMETDLDRRPRLGGPEPGAQPVRVEHELRLLESELARPALRTPGREVYKLYYSGQHDRRQRQLPHADRAARPRATATRSARSTARRRAARCSTSARREPRSTRARPPGVSAAAPAGRAPKFVGFYWGTRGSDFKPRLGEATSTDGATWTKVAGTRRRRRDARPCRTRTAFNKGGERDPSVLYDSGDYDLYFTALSSGGAKSIGFTSTPRGRRERSSPTTRNWSARRRRCCRDGAGFDASR